MILEAGHEEVGIHEVGSAANTLIRTLIEFCRTRVLELAATALVIVWWLQVFAIWVGFFQEVSLLGWPK